MTPEFHRLALEASPPCTTGHIAPDLWIPAGGGLMRKNETAIRACLGCPVRRACREAGSQEKLTGVFGGDLLRNGAVETRGRDYIDALEAARERKRTRRTKRVAA